MKEINDINKIKNIELEILKVVHSFCQKENIEYYLTFGTLIGAIRHNGFIPWDDDIDIFIPRKDYCRFIDIFKMDGYECYSQKTKSYPFTYAKVFDTRTIKTESSRIKLPIGIDIDVFPLDYYYEADYNLTIEKKWKFYCKLWKLSVGSFRASTLIKTIFQFPLKIILHPFSSKISKKIEKLIYVDKKKEPLGYITGFCTSEKIRVYKLEWFGKRILHQFENFDFYIPNGYDEFLKSIYGDYMLLPPMDIRKTHHNFKCYYKNF